MLRANSPLREMLGKPGCDFIEHAGEAIQRILPHVEVGKWRESDWASGNAKWANKRTEIRVTFAIGEKENSASRSLKTSVRRRCIGGAKTKAKRTLDLREYDICRLIALRASEVIHLADSCGSTASIQAIRDAFDEYVVAQHIQAYHELNMSVSEVLEALHILSEQSYENKALTFGSILDPNPTAGGTSSQFPRDFLGSKKYKALSDGFRTAYHISNKGGILSFVDLDRFERKSLSEKHYYPDWAEPMARASRSGKCGVSLSRQGDILVFDKGTLRFTYRYGRWQYWNHAHLVNILRDRARAQRVRPAILGRVVGSIYRAALDVSFRRCGGLFVILHNREDLRNIVKVGDAIGDQKRNKADADFDAVIQQHTIQSLPRATAVELASLDGAVVLENSGRILAYGAVLQPKKAGRLQGTEGSRTKAAIGASNYGLAVKISADGEISVYHKGRAFIRM
ncbi:MAG: DNA integrity scanning protein DisA nucleotide-binding domain protein [Phycisphaerae bacterium]|nr:DNA integrity scanning protein DisA nucleotide-binding domain protein [Phycisphaerae bacterium]